MNKLKKFLNTLVEPTILNEDIAWRQRIANILILASFIISILTFILALPAFIRNPNFPGLNPFWALSSAMFFLFLIYLSKKRLFSLASRLFLMVYFSLAVMMNLRWGALLPSALLFYMLIIVMAGVIGRVRAAFELLIFISTTLITLSWLESRGYTHPDYYWQLSKSGIHDAIFFSLIFFIITVVAWLAYKEIEKNLYRAKESEAELAKERDSLEIKVEERTKELRRAEGERIIEMYRFAEFGKLASGIIHDLVNPMTALSINLKQLENTQATALSQGYLDRALSASHKMEDFVIAIKKQLKKEKTSVIFSAEEEISQTLQIMDYRLKRLSVDLKFIHPEKISLQGDPLRFCQIILNLISNSLDAFEESGLNKNRHIKINLIKSTENILLIISDNGPGIPSEIQTKIFEPFFTTKNQNIKGTSLGLSTVKNIVENNFNGQINCQSNANGTTFTISLNNSQTL